jgi:hypothetical protein
MPTSITSSGITFDDATTQTTSATKALGIGTAQLANGAVTAAKLSGAQTGSAPIYGCRAWVNFNALRNAADTGASTNGANVLIRASGNVSSVLKNATGDYTITFTTAMPDANYCTCLAINDVVTASAPPKVVSQTASTIRVGFGVSGQAFDNENYSVAIFR